MVESLIPCWHSHSDCLILIWLELEVDNYIPK